MGVTLANASDRRVQRTRKLLREALITLILERGWDRITVQDVCKHAGVGRSTFYVHFADQEDLLVGSLNDLKRSLRAQASAVTPTRPLSFVSALLEHADGHRRLFRAIMGKRSGQAVQQGFRQMLFELVCEDLSRNVRPSATRDALLRYISGAVFELLFWWIESRSRLSGSELELIIQRSTLAVLSSLR
ncbi:MAG: TetR/AcrR family transcriptional regulator [Myxococcota bacterium]